MTFTETSTPPTAIASRIAALTGVVPTPKASPWAADTGTAAGAVAVDIPAYSAVAPVSKASTLPALTGGAPAPEASHWPADTATAAGANPPSLPALTATQPVAKASTIAALTAVPPTAEGSPWAADTMTVAAPHAASLAALTGANPTALAEPWAADTANPAVPIGTPESNRTLTTIPPGGFLDSMHTPSFTNGGDAVLNQVFGYYKAPVLAAIIGLQISVQDAPVGAGFSIDLVDGAGALLGEQITLGDGQSINDVEIEIPLVVGAIVRAKVTGVGGTSPGGFINLVLVIEQT